MSFKIINPQALRDARRAQDITQTDLAQSVGCTQQYISMVEQPNGVCSEEIADAICRRLKIEPSDVFGRVKTTVEPV